VTKPPIPDDAPSERDWKSTAEAAKAWSDVAIRLLIVVAVGLLLTSPGLFPFLKQFIVKSGEVNIFGSKFEISQTGSLIPGLEVTDGRLLLQGKDISALPDTIDRLTTANTELQQINSDLTGRVKTISDVLSQVTGQRDDANRTLVGLKQSVPGVKPVETAELDKKIEQLGQTSQVGAPPVAAVNPVPQAAATPDLNFGVAFSADVDKDQAMTEVNKAQGLGTAPIGLFRREKYVRSVAAFPTRDAAARALPTYRGKWPSAYIVDFRTWCPAAFSASFNPGPTPSEIDCRF
jgi:hypothetical protein